MYASTSRGLAAVGQSFTRAFGGTFTGWGDSWVDLNNDGSLELVLASGAIPVTNLAKDAGPIRVLARDGNNRFAQAAVLQNVRVNGRGVAAADYDNDGRVDLAVNTIGGKLLLLHNTGSVGHWLEVDVRPFSPGAVVTLVTSGGQHATREIHAGSSYLSSEDPRVHFGISFAGPRTTTALVVRYPDGHAKRIDDAGLDRLVTVTR